MLRVHYLMQDKVRMSIIFKYATTTHYQCFALDHRSVTSQIFLFYMGLNLITLATFQGNLAVLNILLLHSLIYYLTMSLRSNSRRDGHSSSGFHNPPSSSLILYCSFQRKTMCKGTLTLVIQTIESSSALNNCFNAKRIFALNDLQYMYV